MDTVIVSVLRPLNESVYLRYTSCTVKELTLKVCDHTVNMLGRFISHYKPDDYSCMMACGAYNTALTLLPFLGDDRSHEAFTKACFIPNFLDSSYVMIGFIMKGLEAMAWSLKVEIPTGAKEYFADSKIAREKLVDVPMSFSIPLDKDIRQSLFEERQSDAQMSTELGALLSKWSRFAI